jgi:CarboxypepD_reg-like domain
MTYFKSHPLLFKALLVFTLLMICIDAHAQNINGIVVSANERLSNAIIHNLKTGNRTASDMQGLFHIKANNGDTLITSLLSYKTDTLIAGNQDNIIIRLKSTSKVLREVVIKDSVLSPLKVYNNNKVEYKDIYWKGDKSHIFSIAPGIGLDVGITINIDKLYNALSKEGKDARRLQRELTSDYKNSVVDERFNKTLVAEVTGFKGDELSDFIVKYRPTYEFASKASKYDIIQYIKAKLASDVKTGSD